MQLLLLSCDVSIFPGWGVNFCEQAKRANWYASFALRSSPWLHQVEVHGDFSTGDLPKLLHSH